MTDNILYRDLYKTLPIPIISKIMYTKLCLILKYHFAGNLLNNSINVLGRPQIVNIGVPCRIGQSIVKLPDYKQKIDANNSPPLQANNNSPATASTSPPTTTNLHDKGKLMKQHLVFLLHAKKCESRDNERLAGGEHVIPVSLTLKL